MTMQLYGIPGCNSVKQARAWLAEHGHVHVFHDYKREGADPARLQAWSDAAGWQALLNRRGTTFRKLDPAETADLVEARALALMAAHPSLIRRPVVEHDGGLLIGFDAGHWAAALA